MGPFGTLRVVLGLCALALIVPGAAQGATTLTPNRFDDPAVGGEICGPPAVPGGCSLRGAAEAAKADDTIDLSTGTYVLTQGELDLLERVVIVGDGPGATTIEQAGEARAIDGAPGGLTLAGLTVTGGEVIALDGKDGETPGENGEQGGTASAAGVSGGGPTTLVDVVITGNVAVAGDGGKGASGEPGGEGGRGGSALGVGLSGGNPITLIRVAVLGNVAVPGAGGDGGGGTGLAGTGGTGGKGGSSSSAGVSGSSSKVTIVDSLIAGNVAGTGPAGDGGNSLFGAPGDGGQGEGAVGAGFFTNGEVEMSNVTIAGNVAAGGTSGGGGISVAIGGDSGTAFGGAGAGIAFFNGTPAASGELASVTLSGNVALPPTLGTPGVPGGEGTPGETGNSFPARGGNVRISAAGEIAARNTIFAGGQAGPGQENCAFGGGDEIVSKGHNLEDGAECIATPQAGDLASTPAGTGPLQDNGGPTATVALLPGSAAIDAGEPVCVDAAGEPLAADQRGLPRLSPCDIGAFEYRPAPPVPVPLVQPPPRPTPILAGLKVRPSKLRLGRKARIEFRLNVDARVSFRLRRKLPGVRKRGRCVRRGRKGKQRKGKRCTRFVGVKRAPGALSAHAGTIRRGWRPRHLRPGRYQLLARPDGGRKRGTGFVIRKRKRGRPAGKHG